MRVYIVNLFILVSVTLQAQVDSLPNTTFIQLTDFYKNKKQYTLTNDTTLDNQFNYFVKNSTGNLAHPSGTLSLTTQLPLDLGMHFITPNYPGQLLHECDLKFYKTNKPYTKVFGLVGQKQEQILSLNHTQNLKNFNYSIFVNRSKCKGFYNRQLGILENFAGTFNRENSISRYFIYGWLATNQIKHEENGGINSNQNFDLYYRDNKELISIKLNQAKRVTRQLNTGFLHGLKLKHDSLSAPTRIFHQLNFKRESFVYTDENPDPGYYEEIYADSSITRDSSSFISFNNKIGIVTQLGKKFSSRLEILFKNEISSVTQFITEKNNNLFVYKNFVDSNFVNNSTQLKFFSTIKNFSAELFSEYVYSGFSKNNFILNTNFKWKSQKNKLNVEVNFLTEKRNPDLFYFRYYANNYRWHQNLNSIYTSKLTSKLFLFNKKLYLENVVFQNRNLIWFYTPDLPLQYENNIFSSRSGIGTNLTYEHIYFHAQFNYQYTTNSEIFAIPEFQIQSQLFYQRQSHNKEMQFQAGFQLNYFSSFQSNAYNPGTNMFYVTGRDKCGNYPFIDFFFNAEIQPVKFFILIDHLNQGFSGSNYFLTPGLPMADRSIKFGFTWLFWD